MILWQQWSWFSLWRHYSKYCPGYKIVKFLQGALGKDTIYAWLRTLSNTWGYVDYGWSQWKEEILHGVERLTSIYPVGQVSNIKGHQNSQCWFPHENISFFLQRNLSVNGIEDSIVGMILSLKIYLHTTVLSALFFLIFTEYLVWVWKVMSLNPIA